MTAPICPKCKQPTDTLFHILGCNGDQMKPYHEGTTPADDTRRRVLNSAAEILATVVRNVSKSKMLSVGDVTDDNFCLTFAGKKYRVRVEPL